MRFVRSIAAAVGMLGMLAAVPAAHAEPETFKIDEAHSSIGFLISHFGFSDQLGRFNDFSGTFTIDRENPSNSSVSITIQADSIDTNHAKRDEHLRGPDFLNVKEFPKITFTSTDVEKTGKRSVEITGNLTMHGETHPVTLTGTVNKIAKHPLPKYNKILTAGISARGTLKRSKWGVDAYTPAIGDTMELIVEIEGFDKDNLDKLPD